MKKNPSKSIYLTVLLCHALLVGGIIALDLSQAVKIKPEPKLLQVTLMNLRGGASAKQPLAKNIDAPNPQKVQEKTLEPTDEGTNNTKDLLPKASEKPIKPVSERKNIIKEQIPKAPEKTSDPIKVIGTQSSSYKPSKNNENNKVSLDSSSKPQSFTSKTIETNLEGSKPGNDEILEAASLRLESSPRLEYPYRARRLNQEGKAEVLIAIAEDGRVLRAEIHRGTGFKSLDKEAINYALKLKFAKDSRLTGGVKAMVKVNFILHD